MEEKQKKTEKRKAVYNLARNERNYFLTINDAAVVQWSTHESL